METNCPSCGISNKVFHSNLCGSSNPNQDCSWHLPTSFTTLKNEIVMQIEYILCIKYRLLPESKIMTEDYVLTDLSVVLEKVNSFISAAYKIEAIIIISKEVKGEKNK